MGEGRERGGEKGNEKAQGREREGAGGGLVLFIIAPTGSAGEEERPF